jgi:uncharacterized membrane protein
VLAILGLGFMATNVIGVHFVTAVDKLLLRIPLVAVIYRPLKQVIDAFRGLGGAKQSFKRVVYIDYPVPGMRMIGFRHRPVLRSAKRQGHDLCAAAHRAQSHDRLSARR